jgi:hypothetical protein
MQRMSEETREMRNKAHASGTGRRWRDNLAMALAAVAVFGVTGAALAHDDDDDWKERKHHHRSPPYYVVTPPPVVYVRPPVVYAPPPPVVVYPAPAMSYPEYSGPPGGSLNLGVTVPLR